MKAFVLIVCCLIGNLSLLAQSHVYRPLPDSNTTWVYYQETYSAGQLVFTELVNYYLGEDTVDNGYVYHKVYKYSNSNYKEYIGAYRNVADSMKVYALSEPPYLDGLLIYDFKHEVGDSIYVAQQFPLYVVVVAKDSILINNVYFHYLHIQDPETGGFYINDLWIEGVGTTKELLRSLYYSEFTSSQLYCKRQNHSIEYLNPIITDPPEFCLDLSLNTTSLLNEFSFKVYPLPTTDFIYIKNPVNSKEEPLCEIFDLSGRLLKRDVTRDHMINISDLNIGTYILFIKNSTIFYRTKIIKI